MADPRFFRRAGPFTLRQLAEECGAEVFISSARTAVSDTTLFSDVAPLQNASAEQVSFLDNPRYVAAMRASKAGACIMQAKYADQAPAHMACLISEQPYHTYARLARLYYPDAVKPYAAREYDTRIHPTAIISPDASLAADVTVMPYAIIESGAQIARGCTIGSHCLIGRGVRIDEDTTLASHVTLSHAEVGKRVIMHPGVRIGQDGFGFAMGKQHVKVPQLGRVIIGDDVEIGANTTIDRGTGPDTTIGQGTKIDNLVQIAHNVRIGAHCVIVAQVGIAGSTQLGDYCVTGGQVGIAGHLTIGAGVHMAAQSGVTKSMPAGAVVGGYPAVPIRQFHRQTVVLEKLSTRKTHE